VNSAVECQALGDLYYSTSGTLWGSNAGWTDAAAGTPTDYCSFNETVICPQPGGPIVYLCVQLRCAIMGGEGNLPLHPSVAVSSLPTV
jgi:hypothetical protein